ADQAVADPPRSEIGFEAGANRMRTEPPPLATWMLEHCTPADRDEALAGDLLEGFRSGRSGAWYWRQALTACAVSWCENLRLRSPLLVFALLWSMLAPAWREFTEGIQNAPIFDKIWPLFGAVWIIPAFALWLALNSTFLGIGIVTFILSQTNFKQILRSKSLRRSFPMALFIFVPVYAATFVLVNLYWYSYFAHAKLAATPLGQAADLSILANVTRIPYFIALLCALWNAIPRPFRTSDRVLLDSSPIASSTKSDSRAFVSRLDPYTVKRFFALMVIAGLINAMIAAFLLCRLPESNAPTLTSVFARAIEYVAVGALTGVVGAWVYWKSPSSPFRAHPPIPFPLFALVCAAGWVWVPSMMILSEQISPGTAAVAVVGAILLATGLRKATAFVFAPAQTAPFKTQQAELFAA